MSAFTNPNRPLTNTHEFQSPLLHASVGLTFLTCKYMTFLAAGLVFWIAGLGRGGVIGPWAEAPCLQGRGEHVIANEVRNAQHFFHNVFIPLEAVCLHKLSCHVAVFSIAFHFADSSQKPMKCLNNI